MIKEGKEEKDPSLVTIILNNHILQTGGTAMHLKTITKSAISIFALTLMMVCAVPQTAISQTAVDLNPKLASGQMVQRIDAFEVIIDATESMNDIYKGGTKFNQERTLLNLMNETIPNVKLKVAARQFAQFKAFADATSAPIFGLKDYDKSALRQVISPYPVGSGLSPLDNALDGATADLRSQSGQLAVIAFSDGEDMEKFAPVAAAQRMKSAYGDRVCIYTVHLGEHKAGRKMMQQVADAGGCGFMVAGDALATPAGMAGFVESVFLKTAPPKPAPVVKAEPKPAPVVQERKVQAEAAPVVAKEEPVTIKLDIQFATNKSNIQKKYHNQIKKVADYMTKYPETKVAIEGHTDSVGNVAKNVKLSQKRANSVKTYLVKKFKIKASRITATGYGPKKPIASNATKEGRQQNRRVHAVFSNTK